MIKERIKRLVESALTIYYKEMASEFVGEFLFAEEVLVRNIKHILEEDTIHQPSKNLATLQKIYERYAELVRLNERFIAEKMFVKYLENFVFSENIKRVAKI